MGEVTGAGAAHHQVSASVLVQADRAASSELSGFARLARRKGCAELFPQDCEFFGTQSGAAMRGSMSLQEPGHVLVWVEDVPVDSLQLLLRLALLARSLEVPDRIAGEHAEHHEGGRLRW